MQYGVKGIASLCVSSERCRGTRMRGLLFGCRYQRGQSGRCWSSYGEEEFETDSLIAEWSSCRLLCGTSRLNHVSVRIHSCVQWQGGLAQEVPTVALTMLGVLGRKGDANGGRAAAATRHDLFVASDGN